MRFEAGTEGFGFRILRAETRKELNGRAVYMEHLRTGARLFWLDNGEENKVFSIGFRTLPEDDTGVFHILEHSVLCGSKKYPVKEPFVELLKSSMSTFLNAMTFPDMTLYPVSSRNNRDLLNLTGVYLDAVFDPACIREEKIFRQEGWRIDREDNGEPVYKGVVFNEMKGAMSDVDSLIEQQIMAQLFPDTSYGFNSGGDPEHIVELSYDRFCETYRRFYHPSNAWIYLDGSVPMEEMLSLIDSYLSRFERRDTLPGYAWQRPAASTKTIYYELGGEEDTANKTYYTRSRIAGTWKDRAENMAMGIISDVLTGSNEAPLKREVLKRELAQDLNITVDDTGLQSLVTIQAERVTDGKEAEIDELIRRQGEGIARNGMDSAAVEASINRAVFYLREDEEPQGIGRCVRCMGCWMYGGDPAEFLESEQMVEELRAMMTDGRLNRLAADMLLNREGEAVVRAIPSRTVGAEQREKETASLRHIVNCWTPEQKALNDRLLDVLQDWQQQPDSEAALLSLPVLTKEDADVEPEWIGTEESATEGVPTLYHHVACNGVVHLRAYFPLTDCSLEELTQATMFSRLLGKLPTEKHDAWSLQLEIKRYTGSLGFGVSVRGPVDRTDRCTPYLVAYASALRENAEKAEELISEILLTTRLESSEDNRIAEIVRQAEMGIRQRVISAGQVIGARKALSSFSAENTVRNALEGEPLVRFIHETAQNPETQIPVLREKLLAMLRRTACRKRMTVSVTGDEMIPLAALIREMPDGTPAPESALYQTDEPKAVGFRIPAKVGFAVRGGKLSAYSRSFRGSMWLAAGIISLGYLWNRVRVQGGAYGSGLSVDRAGNVFSYSYRDPTPGKTLSVDAGMSEFLREFAGSGEKLDRYIISALNELNPLLSPRDKGAQADARYLIGLSREDTERVRREVLQTTMEDLLDCCEWLDDFARTGAVCVVAHDDALRDCGNLSVSDL